MDNLKPIWPISYKFELTTDALDIMFQGIEQNFKFGISSFGQSWKKYCEWIICQEIIKSITFFIKLKRKPGLSEADLQTAIKAVTADWELLKISKSTKRFNISFLGRYLGCNSSMSSRPDSSIPDPSSPECSLMIAKPVKKINK